MAEIELSNLDRLDLSVSHLKRLGVKELQLLAMAEFEYALYRIFSESVTVNLKKLLNIRDEPTAKGPDEGGEPEPVEAKPLAPTMWMWNKHPERFSGPPPVVSKNRPGDMIDEGVVRDLDRVMCQLDEPRTMTMAMATETIMKRQRRSLTELGRS